MGNWNAHRRRLLLQKLTDTRFQFVPYRGGTAPAMQRLSGGTNRQSCLTYRPLLIPHIRAGTINAYAVTAKSRLPIAPEIPTVDECGITRRCMLRTGTALFAPKATPKADHRPGSMPRLSMPWPIPQITPAASPIWVLIFPHATQQTPEALSVFHQGRNRKVVAQSSRRPNIKARVIEPPDVP